MLKRLYALAAIALFTAPLAANATMVYGPTGLSGTFTTQNFDINAGESSAAASQFSGIVFGAGMYISTQFDGFFPNIVGSTVINFNELDLMSAPTDPTSFGFTSAVSEIAFVFVSNPQVATFSTFLNNVAIESASFTTGYSGNYIKISGYNFDKVAITLDNTNVKAYTMDNMQYKAAEVPEPASLGLVGIGLASVGFFRRKSAKKA